MINTLLLKSIMVKEGYTSKTLSTEVGLSQNRFSAKINNKARTFLDEADKICDALHITDPALKIQIFLHNPSQN